MFAQNVSDEIDQDTINTSFTSTMNDWEGAVSLQSALKEVGKQFPPSGSKIGEVAKLCVKFSKEYKLVVHELERFIRKASSAQIKACGVFAIDAVLKYSASKAPSRSDDKITKRIGEKMEQLLTHIRLRDFDHAEESGVRRVFACWQVRAIFPESVCALFRHLVSDDDLAAAQQAPDDPIATESKSSSSSSSGNAVPAVPPPTMPPPPPPRRPSRSTATTSKSSSSSSSSSSSGGGGDPRKRSAASDPRKVDPRKRSRMATAAANGSGSPMVGSSPVVAASDKRVTGAGESKPMSVAYDRLKSGMKNLPVRPLSVNSMAPIHRTRGMPTASPTELPEGIETFHFTMYPPLTQMTGPKPLEVRSISRAEFNTMA